MANARSGPVSRLAALVVSALFAIAFGGGGLYFGVVPLVRTALAAWSVQSWQPVPAQVLSSNLLTHHDGDGVTYQVQARYRYHLGGRHHEASRIGLDPTGGSDNVGDWHDDWHERLSMARDNGQEVTAWVNPADPSQAVLDPGVRWMMVMFRLPFALVFTGVGMVALWVFGRTLTGRDTGLPGSRGQDRPATPTGPQESATTGTRNSASRGQFGLWFFVLFWCGISFPMAGLFWMDEGPWWGKLLISVFVVVGIAVLVMALRQSALAWRFAGSVVRTVPSPPRAGASVAVELSLSARALRDRRDHMADTARRLRLAQYRVDDSGSGSSERRVEVFDQVVTVVPDLQGGERWQARFELPGDAPTHGGRRSGERVDWRLEILDNAGAVVVSYDVPVQAVPEWSLGAESVADRFDQRPRWNREEPVPAPEKMADAVAGISAPRLPDSVRVFEQPDAWELRFRQRGWFWFGVLMLLAAAVLALLWWHSATRVSWVEALSNGRWWPMAMLMLSGLHAVSRRRSLTLRDDALVVRIHSWMWTTTSQLPLTALDHLFHKLLYTQGGSDGTVREFHALHARTPGNPTSTRLTPGLSGAESAVAVAQALREAREHRVGRFSPGAARTPSQAGWRPEAGWLLWAVMASAIAVGPRGLQGPPAPTTGEAFEAWADGLPPADLRLLHAQDAGDADELEAALKAGAQPDLLNQKGSSMLMLAAYRGQLAHVDLLLRHGASPDLRQTQNDSQRDDTALLRALYGGHLAVAQRLVQGGATMRVKNRWDWGPVHMAAQSGCVPCLDWLAGQGLALDEPATASRGETPPMLSAARGKVEALVWFEARGVDLWAQDPHGKDALDWARWRQQKAAEDWLMARRPAGR